MDTMNIIMKVLVTMVVVCFFGSLVALPFGGVPWFMGMMAGVAVALAGLIVIAIWS